MVILFAMLMFILIYNVVRGHQNCMDVVRWGVRKRSHTRMCITNVISISCVTGEADTYAVNVPKSLLFRVWMKKMTHAMWMYWDRCYCTYEWREWYIRCECVESIAATCMNEKTDTYVWLYRNFWGRKHTTWLTIVIHVYTTWLCEGCYICIEYSLIEKLCCF